MRNARLLSALFLFFCVSSLRAQTVFTDNYDRSPFSSGGTGGSPSTTYTSVTSAGTVTSTLVSGSNYMLAINSAAGTVANDKAYVWAPLTGFSSPWSTTLSSNPGIITWTFNMRTSTAVTVAGVTAGSMGGAVDLCGNAAGNIYNGSPTGYGVVFNSGAAGGVNLVRFSGGMISSAVTVLITETTTVPKTDYYSVRVTYNPSTNGWSLYLRDDGAGGFADPSSGVTTQQGSTVTDATYTSQAMNNFGVVFSFTTGAGKSMYFDNFTVSEAIPACSGTPSPGTISASTTSGCGLSYTSNLSVTGGSNFGSGFTYQWQSSSDNITWSNVTGATNSTYTASVTATVYYRRQITCSNSGLSATTPAVECTITVPTSATLPFSESFESGWINGCGTADQPNSHWVGRPASGNRSWRRVDDPGGSNTANWASGNIGVYTPWASDGSYSAEFDTWDVASGNSGALELYITLPAGTKQMTYDYINTDGSDQLVCQISTDGGATYTTLDLPPTNASTWSTESFTFTAAASPAIIRFVATSDFGVTNIGLDNITICVIPPPVSGTAVLCAGATSTLSDAITGGAWSSSDVTIATVGSATGIVTGVAGGIATITYNNGFGCNATIPFTVNGQPAPPGGITSGVCTGSGQYLTETVGGGTYTSVNTAVATVGPLTGIVTGVSAGTSVISYTMPTGCNSFTTVTVIPSPSAITGPSTLCTGNTATLSSSPAGGTWTSSNPVQATIDLITPVVTAIYPGSSIITYQVPNGCFATAPLTIYQSPSAIGGIGTLCVGGSLSLNNALPGGVWSCANPALATMDPTGVVSGLNSGTPTVSYTIPGTGCYAAAAVAVSALPVVYTLSGGGAYCAGDAGMHIYLSGSDNGVDYQLYLGSAMMATVSGTGATLDFGPLGDTGNYTITAVNSVTGCTSNMTGTVNISVNPAPIAFNVTGSGGYCDDGSGTMGLSVGVDSSSGTDLYYLYKNSVLIAGPVLGTGGPFTFPGLQDQGTYTITATGSSTGCNNAMVGSAVVVANPIPAVDTVIGGGSYCFGGLGVHVGLDYSSTGINYQLFDNTGVAASPVIPGSNASLDFGLITATGTFTVVATNAASGCTNAAWGSASVGVNSLPANTYTFVTPTDAYCAGDTGVHVQLTSSDYGINYQLLRGGRAVGAPVAGGGLIDFGLQRLAGTYTALATDATTNCVSMMAANEVISINPLPAIDTVTGGGGYCAGGAGSAIGLNYGASGINYQLFDNTGTAVSALIGGANSMLSFGVYSVAATYTAIATDALTHCSSNMYGSASVLINPLPDIDTVTGGGNYCTGGAGVHIGLNYAQVGISYSLYNGAIFEAGVSGANSGLDFGLQTAPGTYSVTATNIVNGCSSTMYGNAAVIENAPPAPYIVTSGASSFCAGGAGVHIYLSNSDAGISYQLYNAGMAVGTPVGSSSGLVDFGLQTGSGAYTVLATDAGSGCTRLMSGSPVISVDPLPDVYTVTGGGSFCSGGRGVAVGLNNSARGTTYQLMYGPGTTGAPVAGTGSAITFGPQALAGNYTVIATSNATNCSNIMNSSATINVNPNPAVFTVTGGGNYCNGAAGVHVGLSTSAAGVQYQLYDNGAMVGRPLPGTGAALDFGFQAAAGTYAVAATDMATACGSNMAGSTSISIYPSPYRYSVFGGGDICVGDPGVSVMLSGSATGIDYQLYHAGVAVSGAVSGTGVMLDFGYQSMAGAYTVIATDPVTSCADTMLRSASVNVNPLPGVYPVTGGGDYCSGGTGVHIGMPLSTIGVDYQLYYGGTVVGRPVHGAGMAIDFGILSGIGSYSVVATDVATGCVNTMGTVSVNSLPWVTPAVSISSSAPATLCAAVPVTLTANPVNGGASPVYHWFVNGIPAGSGISYSYLPSNGDAVTAVMNSSASCVTTPTASDLTTISVTPNQLPTAAITADPGHVVCPGTQVTYSASTTYGGAAPAFTWLVNSRAGGSGSTFTYTPADNDVVVLLMASDYVCRAADTVFSNDFLMSVENHSAPMLNLSADPGVTIAPGQNVTITASVVNGGSSVSYKWYLNNRLLPAPNTPVISSSNFNDGDSVTCVVTTDGPCGMTQSFNSIVISISTLGVKPVTFSGLLKVLPNPNKGVFSVKGTLPSAADESISVEISDMIGQVIYKNSILSHNGIVDETITLGESLANGMYILTLRSGTENAIFHIVVER